jgi:hypothetical protein
VRRRLAIVRGCGTRTSHHGGVRRRRHEIAATGSAVRFGRLGRAHLGGKWSRAARGFRTSLFGTSSPLTRSRECAARRRSCLLERGARARVRDGEKVRVTSGRKTWRRCGARRSSNLTITFETPSVGFFWGHWSTFVSLPRTPVDTFRSVDGSRHDEHGVAGLDGGRAPERTGCPLLERCVRKLPERDLKSVLPQKRAAIDLGLDRERWTGGSSARTRQRRFPSCRVSPRVTPQLDASLRLHHPHLHRVNPQTLTLIFLPAPPRPFVPRNNSHGRASGGEHRQDVTWPCRFG